MIYINLERDKLLMLERDFNFSGGEIQIRIPVKPIKTNLVTVYSKVLTAEDLVKTILVGNAIRNQYKPKTLILYMPYFTYSRQDRVCVPGEANSLECVMKLLSTVYTDIATLDMHSEAYLKLPEGRKIINIDVPIDTSIFNKIDTVIAPDKGAVTRATRVGNLLKVPTYYASKTRDPDTGYLVYEGMAEDTPSLDNKHILIVDDICDGGMTFILLAKKLKELYKEVTITLLVTHGIFSKGVEVLLDAGISNIITTNSFYSEEHENVKVIDIW